MSHDTDEDIAENNSVKSVETWGDLLKILGTMTPEQLDQPVQVIESHPCWDHVREGQKGICIGTVDDMQIAYFRSVTDNRRRGEQVVLFTDGNPYAEDGAIGYEWMDDGEDKPIYRKNHCDEMDWTGPAQRIADARESCQGEGTEHHVINHRLKGPMLDPDVRPEL